MRRASSEVWCCWCAQVSAARVCHRTHRAGGVPLLKAPLGLLHVAHPCRRPHAVHPRLGGQLEVSVECRSVCSEARVMAGTAHRAAKLHFQRTCCALKFSHWKKKGSKSKYLPAKSDRKTDTVERNAPQSRSTTDLELARVPRPTSYLHRYRPARDTDRVTRGARAHSCRSHCALRRGERGGATWPPLPLLRRRRGRGTAGHSPLR